MKFVKLKLCVWTFIFSFSLISSGFAQDEIGKAPQSDALTVKEVERITKGDLADIVKGRGPVSITIPNEKLDKMREIFDSGRMPKDDTYRAPAIVMPKSRSISQ